MKHISKDQLFHELFMFPKKEIFLRYLELEETIIDRDDGNYASQRE